MSMDQTINELRSRVAKLERENTGSQAQTMQDLITEKILELLAENSEDYIPMIATLSADIRSLKKTVESELKAMKQQLMSGVSNNAEEVSRLEIDAIRRIITSIDHSLTEKINHLSKEMDDNFNKVYHTITNSPLICRMDMVEMRLPTYASNDRVNSLQEALLECASTIMVENLIIRVNKLDEIFLTRIDYDLYTEQLVKDMEEKLADKLGRDAMNQELDNYDSDVQERIDRVQKSIDSAKKQVKKLQADFMEVVEVTNSQTELLKQKVDFEEVEKIWKNFEKYSMYEDLKDLYMKTVPEIYKFEQKIEEHRRDIEKQSEVLRRFDEVISDKASKGNLREVVAEAEKTYAKKDDFIQSKQILNDKCYENSKKIQFLQDTIDILGKTITKDIFSAVKKATGHLQGKSAMAIGGAGLGNMQEITEELKQLVNQKADKQQLIDLSTTKANKIDTELSMRWIEVINRQLKQIIVLMTEMLRFEVQKNDLKVFEGEQHIQHNKAFLFQQALLISQWVNKFHTQQVNEYFLESSNGVTELNWTPPDIVAFQRFAEQKLQEVDLECLVTRNEALAMNLKLRSKTVARGAQSLAVTQTHFYPGGAPQSGLKLGSKAITVLNNKVHYSNSKVVVTRQDSVLGGGSSLDQELPTSDKKPEQYRTLNNESQLLSSPPPNVPVQGAQTQISRYSSMVGSRKINPGMLNQTTKDWASNKTIFLHNKNLMHTPGRTSTLGGALLGSPIQLRNGGGIIQSPLNGEDKQFRKALLASVRKSLNLPGIESDGKARGKSQSVILSKE